MRLTVIWERALRMDGPTDSKTDQRMDGRTDTPSYRDAAAHLKTARNKPNLAIISNSFATRDVTISRVTKDSIGSQLLVLIVIFSWPTIKSSIFFISTLMARTDKPNSPMHWRASVFSVECSTAQANYLWGIRFGTKLRMTHVYYNLSLNGISAEKCPT